MEIWKDISNYEGLYQVSNLGRVKSLERIIIRKNNKQLSIKEKILKPQNMKNYKFVRLSKNNETKQHFIHRLVAQAFLDNQHNYNEVNHKDENPSNNIVSNLEWCSHKYNMNYGTINIRRAITEKNTKKGRVYNYNHNCNHKGKKVVQYDLQGNFIKEWKSIAEASKTLKLNKIWEVCNNKRNKCGNFIWKYKGVDGLCS